jgi:hypothetical protein
MSACVSFDVDTDTTFTAKRQSLAAGDDFALLKALCFAEVKTPIESQRSRNRYGSVHSEFIISRNVGSNYATPARHLELCASMSSL